MKTINSYNNYCLFYVSFIAFSVPESGINNTTICKSINFQRESCYLEAKSIKRSSSSIMADDDSWLYGDDNEEEEEVVQDEAAIVKGIETIKHYEVVGWINNEVKTNQHKISASLVYQGSRLVHLFICRDIHQQ